MYGLLVTAWCRAEGVRGAVGAELAEWRHLPGVDGRDRRPSEAGEDQPAHGVPDRLPGDLHGGGVAAGPVREADRPCPACRVGEHEVHAGRPVGELEEFGRLGHPLASRLDQVPERVMRGVHHRVPDDLQAAAGVAAGVRGQVVRGRQPPQVAGQLRPLVGDQPRGNSAGRGGAGAAVDGGPCPAVLGDQPRRGRVAVSSWHRRRARSVSGPSQLAGPPPGRVIAMSPGRQAACRHDGV